jgi:hypothetical protein
MELLECEICFNAETDFIRVCQNKHSFCWYCSGKIRDVCPKCRLPVQGNKTRDHERNRGIQERLDGFSTGLKRNMPQDVDVMDCDGNWCRATIIDHNQDCFKVHYYGWDGRWDEWVHCRSGRIMPLNTYTEDWLECVHVGQSLEFMLIKDRTRRWYAGTVVSILPSGKNILLVKQDPCGDHPRKEYKIRLDKDHLTPVGTHTPFRLGHPLVK